MNHMKNIKNKPQNTSFLKAIKNAIPKHCSNCGHKYQSDDLTLIKKDEYTAVLHITCSNCKESYLINVISPLGKLQGASRMQLKVDINTPEEAKKFIGSDKISSDDILNIHEKLKELDSDEFKKVIKPSELEIDRKKK